MTQETAGQMRALWVSITRSVGTVARSVLIDLESGDLHPGDSEIKTLGL